MWFIPTRNRPDSIKKLIASMESAGCVPECAIMIDGPMAPYKDIEWPEHWHIHQSDTHLEMSGALNALFKLYPNEKFYGFMCDHGRPKTPDWSSKLESSAGNWNIACANDLTNRYNPNTGNRRVTEGTCFGGDLVRAVGWLWPDYMVHLYGDDVWEDIGHKMGIMVWCNDVIIETHMSSPDDNHKRIFNGDLYAAKDRAAYFGKWINERNELYNKLEALIPNLTPPANSNIIIACINADNYLGRGVEYVNILANSVARNISKKTSYKFICFTDSSGDYDCEIDVRPLPVKGLTGWWNKLALFKKDVFPDGARVIYLDLDTVIVSGLDEIIKYKGEFAALRDFYHPDNLASGVMAWEAGTLTTIWDTWIKVGKPKTNKGDQLWIEKMGKMHAQFWQDIYPNCFISYKIHAEHGVIPKDAKMVIFHGTPRPHEITHGWMPHVWKIDGGTIMELKHVGNVSEHDIAKNIRNALTLSYPWLQMTEPHDSHAVIIGGGPSLKDNIEEIRHRQNQGQTIFSTNNTYNYLVESDIISDCQVMIDGREENKEFIRPISDSLHYLASQCHPAVFDKVKNKNVVLFHSFFSEGIFSVIGHETGDPLVGGGCTVGLHAIALAWILGFRNFHLYGFDSSYMDGENHAYKQPLNDNDRIIEVIMNGKKYNCAPWMATQVENFKTLAKELVDSGCIITVHGSGLLPDVARLMTMSEQPIAA